MYRACIALVDASRARLFRFERSTESDGTHEELIEQTDLVNPARRLRPSALFSDSRPGSNRTGRLQNAFDDHRNAHIDQLDAEFARSVVAELARMLEAARAQRLIICASPHMLGELRSAGVPRRNGMELDELPRDLVKLSATEIRDQLASYGVLPPRPPRPRKTREL